MPNLLSQLELERCPHCNVDRPTLTERHHFDTVSFTAGDRRFWGIYVCSRCGGVVTAGSLSDRGEVNVCYPSGIELEHSIPQRARDYLSQAINSLSSPAGAIMLAASAVDAMLRAKDLRDGSLYNRIDLAAEQHLITDGMAQWAHEVRLEANDQRHPDNEGPLPGSSDAQRAVEFARSLAQFMFVLPARVDRGLQEATHEEPASDD